MTAEPLSSNIKYTKPKYSLNGLILYRFRSQDQEDPDIIRIYRVMYGAYQVLDLNDPYHKKMIIPAEEIDNHWVKLNPDGIMAFSIVEAATNEGDTTPDVTIRFHKINKGDDIDKEGVRIQSMPFCICRQSVLDIFMLMQQSKYIAGMSISQKTCPPEIDFMSQCAYTKMTRNVNVAYYMDDTVDSILECFRNKAYEDALRLIKTRSKMLNQVSGYCDTLKQLMNENHFMLDVHDGLGIMELPKWDKYQIMDFENPNLNKMVTDYIITNRQVVPTKFYPRWYTKYISFADISRPYILLSPDSTTVEHDAGIVLVAYDVSDTLSVKDYLNKGMSYKHAKKEIMKQLGWT